MPATDFSDYLNIGFVDNGDLPENNSFDYFQTKSLPFAASSLFDVEIIDAKKLTTGEDVNVVYDLVLNVENIKYEFEPGNTVGILPSNNNSEVDQLLRRLNLTSVANQYYSLNIIPNTTKKKAAIPSHIPPRGTIREVFLKCLDIRSVPTKIFLRSLIRYTADPDDIEILQNICSPGGSKQYNDFIIKNGTLLKLLETFPSCHPPIERLLEYLPSLKPRPYSISSSPLSNSLKKVLHITFAVTNLDKDTKGVCTGWLENCIEKFYSINKQLEDNLETLFNDLHIVSSKRIYIPLYFRKNNNFQLPTEPTTPIIMIGPGTGVAPFVGFLEHRFLQPHIKFGPSWLFYGCRYNNRDFLFQNQIRNFQKNQTVTKLCVCFSRENNKKRYVQDLILENKNDFVNLIMHQNAIVYVCGNVNNMLKDIRSAIVSCLVDIEGLSDIDAESYVREMELANKYIKDIWI